MLPITRREFLQKAAGMTMAMAATPHLLVPSGRGSISASRQDQLYSSLFPFNYDTECFASSERVFFEDRNRAYINVFIKPEKTLDIKLYIGDTRAGLSQKMPINLTGVEDSLDIFVGHVHNPEFYYKVEYRDERGWRSHESRYVKTPNVDLNNSRKVKVILKGDDHIYADLKHEPSDEGWRRDVLSGDYISRMLKEIIANPDYVPEFGTQRVVYGFTLAHTLKYILEARPDIVIDLGDTVGPDSYRVWGGEGQWPELQPEDNYVEQSRILWERKRRTLAAITPEIPYYLALGNHDGEVGWFTDLYPFTQPYARPQRKRLLRQPKILRIPERIRLSSHRSEASFFRNLEQNYFPIFWADGDVRFLILDVNTYMKEKPDEISDWTLGEKQKLMAELVLSDGSEAPWKFICYHNTLGGYPLGPGIGPGAYGRGPLFTREDYERINEIDPGLNINPDMVEQVWLTEMAKEFNVRGFFYAHDHAFFKKDLGKSSQEKDMIGACVGATTYSGPLLHANIWSNPYWMAYYGPYYEIPPPFLTTPGITEIEIDKHGATVKYVCTAPPECMYSNMPAGTKPGDVLREYHLSS
jgi:hypothetical protein